MSFIIDLPPEVETRLQVEASRQGVPAATVALRLVTENLPGTEAAPEEARPSRLPLPKGIAKNRLISVEEWEALLNAWRESADPAVPAIELESMRRANLYEERI